MSKFKVGDKVKYGVHTGVIVWMYPNGNSCAVEFKDSPIKYMGHSCSARWFEGCPKTEDGRFIKLKNLELVEEKPNPMKLPEHLHMSYTDIEPFDVKEHMKLARKYFKDNFTTTKPIKKTKKTIMKTLTDNMKRMLSKKHQTLYKTGYLNGDLEYTDKAERALMQHLLKENEEVLVNLGEEEIKKVEEEKKK